MRKHQRRLVSFSTTISISFRLFDLRGGNIREAYGPMAGFNDVLSFLHQKDEANDFEAPATQSVALVNFVEFSSDDTPDSPIAAALFTEAA